MKPANQLTSAKLLSRLVAVATFLLVAGVRADKLLQHQQQLQQQSPSAVEILEQSSKLIHQQHNQMNNGPPRSPVAAHTVALVRARRSPLKPFPVSQAAIQAAYQPARDRLVAARHELSDLITQAHRDKQAERRLMKLLINFKLASDLDDIAYPISANRLMLDDNSSSSKRAQADEEENPTIGYPQLENFDDNGEPVADELSLAEFQLGKRREYIKPCMFNAVSCAKNPFKKY